MTDNETHAHVKLQAYHDRELGTAQAQRVEAHLATCPTCRDELAALRALSSLLQTAPPAPRRVSNDQFAAQVALKLPRRCARTPAQQVLLTGWWLTPALVVSVWLFIQTTALLTNGIAALLTLGIGAETIGAVISASRSGSWWTSEIAAVIATVIGFLAPEAVPVAQAATNSLCQVGKLLGAANLMLPLGVGLLLWSWIASWIAIRRHPLKA